MVKDSTAVNSTWLDSVALIKDITDQDALFVFKDGTVSRLPIISGNRYLYFANGRAEIGKFESVEFLSRPGCQPFPQWHDEYLADLKQRVLIVEDAIRHAKDRDERDMLGVLLANHRRNLGDELNVRKGSASGFPGR
jgi:hypothetical protein